MRDLAIRFVLFASVVIGMCAMACYLSPANAEPVGKQPPQFGLLTFESDRGSGVVLHDRGSYRSVEIRNNETEGATVAFYPETENESVNRATLTIAGDGLRIRTAKGKLVFIDLDELAALNTNTK